MQRSNTKRYDKSFRLSAVKLKLEKGFSLKAVARELGMTDTKQIRQWIQRYNTAGESGLEDRKPKMAEATKKRRAKDKELEEALAENAILKYLLKAKKKDDMKRLRQ